MKFRFFILYLIIQTTGMAQLIEPEILVHLPAVLYESSGVEISDPNSIWTQNDSGDSARIYNIDTLGNILRTITFDVDEAIDCEESARDAAGNYYLGDFGNNANDRTNLRIYKIPDPDTLSVNKIIPQLITFHFEDQQLFPPDSAHMNFDCEAMFHFQDSLYLFSKNRGTSMFCKMYRLPDDPGDYVAELVDSFNIGTWVTSADISPSGERMVLLSESRLWLFFDITDTDFFSGNAQMFNMYFSQKEAIVFVDDSTLYLTDEYFSLLGNGGNLYRIDLNSVINGQTQIEKTQLMVFPNPATDVVYITIPESRGDFFVKVFDASGRMVQSCKSRSEIDISSLCNGQYFIRVLSVNNTYFSEFEKW
ncbi:MAG TPA: T9SS type A sorting domain-containing protein [Bacteroidales bacterium]|nr:T9SS type A sorting domain-containing protein [Bacteroidales bacterium]